MTRKLVAPFHLDDDQLAWDVLTTVEPGQDFLTTDHTLQHCRDAFTPNHFTSASRDDWEVAGAKSLLERVKDAYVNLIGTENRYSPKAELAKELDDLVSAADRAIS